MRSRLDDNIIDNPTIKRANLDSGRMTLAGNITLDVEGHTVWYLDAGGANRNVTLSGYRKDAVMFIANIGASHNISVIDPAAASLGTIEVNTGLWLFCSGDDWISFAGGSTATTFTDGTGLFDDSGNELLIFQKATSAVNYVEMGNAATGVAPYVGVEGDNTNIDFRFKTKGTGSFYWEVNGSDELKLTSSALEPNANDGLALGSTSKRFADIYLASAAIIDFNGVATITNSGPSVVISALALTTDLAVADGGTGASNAADARTNLGLVIGTNVQAYDVDLTAIAALATTDGNIIVGDGATWVAESGATARTSLGLGTGNSPQFTAVNIGHASDTQLARVSAGVASIGGSNVLLASGLGSITQAYDVDLAAIAALTSAANKLPYATGAGTWALTDLTTTARGLLDDADEATMRTTLGLAIGTNVQAYDADLAAIAALATSDNNFIVGNGSTWVAESGSTVRTSLGLTIDTDVAGVERGSWTPVLTCATPGNLSVSYTTQMGRYERNGKLVTLYFNITTSAFTHTTASGQVNITGIPFTCLTLSGLNCLANLTFQGITKANFTQFNPRIQNNATTMQISASGSAQTTANLVITELPTGGSVILYGSVTYPIT